LLLPQISAISAEVPKLFTLTERSGFERYRASAEEMQADETAKHPGRHRAGKIGRGYRNVVPLNLGVACVSDHS
jgi:hypothetical protein